MRTPYSAASRVLPLLLVASTHRAAAHARLEPDVGSALQAPGACESDPHDGDFDRDGICDAVERATGTSANRKDTDGDGIPDGEEDKDRDGIVDPGETDPRSPGLFPGSAPHIPEPLVFDLVRGLGAKKGEVEINTLGVLYLPRGGAPTFHWAPEVEWALFDGFAVELELPMVDRELHSLKGAMQYTLPWQGDAFTHGLQWLGEAYLGATGGGSTSLLYLAGGRLGSWSLFSMSGARVRSVDILPSSTELLVNPSVYYDVVEELTLGLETNIASDFAGSTELHVIPQLHYQVTRRFRVQLGGGFVASGDRLAPLAASRLILE